jgi:hypothetical protein
MEAVDFIAPPDEGLAEAVGKLEDVELRLLERLPEQPAAQTEEPDGIAAQRQEWYRQVQDAVLTLSATFPDGVDDYDLRKLLEYTVELGKLIEADCEGLDPEGEVELAWMRTADVLRRIQRRVFHQNLDDPAAALELIFGVFANVNLSDVATLLDTSTKTAAAWKAGAPVRLSAKRRRIVTVAQILSYLRDSITPHGLVMWFEAERDQLDGLTPLEVLDEDPNAYARLIDLARGSRGQLGG